MQNLTSIRQVSQRHRRGWQLAASEQTKTIGRTVGILYILGTIFGILSVAVTSSISGSDDILGAVASHEAELALGALLILSTGFVLAMIPIVAYPILSEVDTMRARGYFLFRSVLETGTYLMAAVAWLLLIPLSGSSVPGVFGEALFNLEGAAAAGTIAFLVGAAMFYTILFQRRLIPQWLSVWGLAAIVPYLIPVFLDLFTDSDVSSVLFDLPLALQEMVLAVWLIVKGFAGDRAASPGQMEV